MKKGTSTDPPIQHYSGPNPSVLCTAENSLSLWITETRDQSGWDYGANVH